MGGTGRPLGKTFFLHCRRRHPEVPKIPTYLPTYWEGFGVEEGTWEPISAFVLPEGRLNSVLVDYLSGSNLGNLLRLAETLGSQKKPRD